MGTNSLTFDSLVRKGFLHSAKLASWQNQVLRDMKRRIGPGRNVWILSSGTQSVNQVKAIELTRQALLTSAAAVNKHLRATSRDRWLLTLPAYHVGGLGILARAKLSKSEVFSLARWSVKDFVRMVEKHKISLVSLVPTQVFDLVEAGAGSPKSLRAIVVGGGSLDPNLYLRARQLGWPLLTSYGLTECCSQVATASLATLKEIKYPHLTILPHVKVKLREGRVFLKSKSLAETVAVGRKGGEFAREEPKRDGWLATEDLAEMRNGKLHILGRRDDVVKVLGALVPVNQVEHKIREHFMQHQLTGDLTVLAVKGGREENRLILVTNSKHSLSKLESAMIEFNSQVPGPERIKQLCWVDEIPRNELGKIKKAELSRALGLF
jgi:O-succinylbenzoic acid--CoA ligase